MLKLLLVENSKRKPNPNHGLYSTLLLLKVVVLINDIFTGIQLDIPIEQPNYKSLSFLKFHEYKDTLVTIV